MIGAAKNLMFTGGAKPTEAFIANLTVTAGDEYHKMILYTGTQYDFTIDWGDGTVDTIASSTIDEAFHTYATTGNYVITIDGVVRHLAFQHGFIDGNLKEVVQLGKCSWESFNSMFKDCIGLHTVTPGTYDLSNVQDFTSAWSGCTVLTNFPLLLMPAATSLNSTWRYNYALTSFPEIDISGVTNLSSTWINCEGLTSFPLLNTSSVTQASYAWNRCLNLTEFPLLDLSNCTNFGRTWNQCYALATFPALDMSSATSLYETWRSCALIPSLDDITFGPNIINAEGAFYDCEALTEISYTFGLSSPTNFNNTFYGCKAIVNIHSYDFSAAQTMVQTFSQMTSLVSLPRLETSLCTNFDYAFNGTIMLTCMQSLDTTGANPLDLDKLWSNAVYFVTPNSTDRDTLSGSAYWENTGTPCGELTYDEYVLSLNPIAYYRLGETGSDTIAVDEINGYNGTYIDSPDLDAIGLLPNDSDTSAHFTGTSWLSINSLVEPLKSTTTGTFSYIWKVIDGESARIAYNQSFNNTTQIWSWANMDGVFYLCKTSAGDFGPDNFTISTSDFIPVIGNSYIIDIVQDPIEGCLIYINGQLQITSANATPGDRWFNDLTVADRFSISHIDALTQYDYLSNVDELAFWDRQLTQTEIENKFNASGLGWY